ncbi:hypothetical protein SAMN05421753_104123 [Planctomicrobium piriforme]|uniref:Uncharacterized protein n=1 Tax=Planctomicrobium piriforme TaxID=1576369 RepID=A0A1I3E8R0_9PLAN|nr:hypothetical protein SAMN05421753_104123 [Planctomicrobium piriforme]
MGINEAAFIGEQFQSIVKCEAVVSYFRAYFIRISDFEAIKVR